MGFRMQTSRQYCLRIPAASSRTGTFCFPGAVVMPTSRPDGYLNTRESAALVGVSPKTISYWRSCGDLVEQGLDERGYPLHTPEAVRAADRRVRERGIARGGVDPRRLRGRARTPEPRAPSEPDCIAA